MNAGALVLPLAVVVSLPLSAARLPKPPEAPAPQAARDPASLWSLEIRCRGEEAADAPTIGREFLLQAAEEARRP